MESWCYSGSGRKHTCLSGIADLWVLWWQEGTTVGTRGRDNGWVQHAPQDRCCPCLSFLAILSPGPPCGCLGSHLLWQQQGVGVGERLDHFLSTSPVKLPLRNLEQGFWATGR